MHSSPPQGAAPDSPRLTWLERGKRLWQHPQFRVGLQDMSGPSLGLAAWGLVTGVAMVKSGLSLAQCVGMTLLVFAGSAQLTSLPLLAAGAPLWVILATAFCVNLRFVIFSVQWRTHFGHLPRLRRWLLGYVAGDMTYVSFAKRFPTREPHPDQERYFWGTVAVNWTSWQVASLVGIFLADRIPTQWGLGFAGVLALLGLAYSLINTRWHWITAGVAATVSILTYNLPLHLNIVCAIAVAGVVGWWLQRHDPNHHPH